MIDPKYYDNYFDLFINKGWMQFISECKENHENIRLEDCKSWDDFLVKKTEKIMLSRIIEFENQINKFYEHQNKQVELEVISDV